MEHKIENISSAVGKIYLGDWLIDLYDDYALKEKIHSLADLELNSLVLNKKSVYTLDKVLIVSLIIISMEKYDGSFYDHIQEYYEKTFENNDVSYQTINNRVREAIRITFTMESEGNISEDVRVINDVLKQSFVPIKYLGAFFDFVYDIYKYNYDYSIDFDTDSDSDLTQELSELFLFLFDSEDISSEYEVNLEGSYRSYKLIKSTRDILTDKKYSQSAISLVINILRIIDSIFYDTDRPDFLKSGYYELGIEQWESKENAAKDRTTDKKGTSGDRTILKPFIDSFDYNTKKLIIQTRRHILTNYQEGDKVEILIKNNNQVVLSDKDLVIKEILGGVRIEPKKIGVNEFLGNLEYCLIHNEKEIYSSKRLINTDVLMFNQSGDLLARNNDYVGNVMLITSLELNDENFSKQVYQFGNLYLGHKTESMLFDFGTVYLSYKEKVDNKILGEVVEYLECTVDGKVINVYKNVDKIVVETKTENKENIIINISNKNEKIPPENIIVLSNGTNTYLEIDLSSLEIQNSFHKLKVLDGGSGTLGSFSFVLDDCAGVNETYNRSKGLEVRMKSSFFPEINTLQTITELETSELLTLEKDFTIYGRKLRYKNVYRCLHYELNDRKYFHTYDLWHEDITPIVVIKNIDSKTVTFKYGGKVLHTENVINNELRIERNRFSDIMLSNQVSEGILNVSVSEIREIGINVLFSNLILKEDTGISRANNKHYFSINYKGMNKMTFSLMSGPITIFSKQIINSEILEVQIRKDVYYHLQIEEETRTVFNEISKKIIYKTNYYEFSENKLYRSIFSLVSAIDEFENKEMDIRNITLENIRCQDGSYSGDLFGHNYRSDYPLYKLNPVKIEIITPIFYESNFFYEKLFEFRIVDKDEDGLLINERKKDIYFEGEHMSFPTADSFLIRLKKEG